MIKQLYINGEFTVEQLEQAAKAGVEARREAFVKNSGRESARKVIAKAELAGLEAALDALTDMWSQSQEDPDNA